MKKLPYISAFYIGPNPQDRNIYMVDYDNKGYRGGTDTFKSKVKLDKKLSHDDIFDVFKGEIYNPILWIILVILIIIIFYLIKRFKSEKLK